jgi:hypothetical protein
LGLHFTFIRLQTGSLAEERTWIEFVKTLLRRITYLDRSVEKQLQGEEG